MDVSPAHHSGRVRRSVALTPLLHWLRRPLGKACVQLLCVLLMVQGWPLGAGSLQVEWRDSPFARLFGLLPVAAQSSAVPNPDFTAAL